MRIVVFVLAALALAWVSLTDTRIRSMLPTSSSSQGSAPAAPQLSAPRPPAAQPETRLLRPRAVALSQPPMEYLVGLVCLLLAVVLVLPVPLGNMLPALAISLLALGILERDGLWILAGLVAAAVSAVVVSGVVYAAVKAAVFFFREVL